jgi:hypothetical protein
MSMKAMLLAAATAATLLAPAVASAQDYGRHRDDYRRDDRRIETRRWHDGDRRAYTYGYGYNYRYARPAWRGHDWRWDRRWSRDHRWERDHDRRY